MPHSCLKSSHSRSLPSRFLRSSLSIFSLISLKFLCPRILYSPHLSPPDMHLPLPQVSGGPGAPSLLWGFTIQETSPAAQAHAQPYLHIAEWEERLSFLSSLPPPMCPQPPFFLRWCYSWLPTGNGLPLSAECTPFLEGTSYCFVRGVACPDWCYWGRRVSPLSPSGGDLGPQ